MLLSSNLFEMLSALNLFSSLKQRFSRDVILRHMTSSTSKSDLPKFQMVTKFPTTGKKGLKIKNKCYIVEKCNFVVAIARVLNDT